MRKLWAVLGTVLFFLIAPVTAGLVVPWWIAGWQMAPPFLGLPVLRTAGFLLAAAGAVPLVESFARFALVGLGTPAPIAPPKHLVVTGFYRHVRNPMYVAVIAVILGDALILGNAWIFAYAVLFLLTAHIYVRIYEEPTLKRLFGAEYAEFRAHVPRWLPRLTPWTQARRE
jgi:protein-S-isoprenylcysteine O-methyltransferase Ste14